MHDISALSIAGLSKRIAVAEVSGQGVQSLGILDKDNAWQIVLLRDPLMLPRPAAIT